ncbi:MAG TPA: IPT/TIG domain-containing protein [Chitinophagaceae bacterium]
MKKILLFIFIALIFLPTLICAQGQKPAISYQSPQTAFIGQPLTPVRVTNTGGAVPVNINPQSSVLVSVIGGDAPDPFVRSASGDIYAYENYVIYHIAANGTETVFAGGKPGSVDGTGSLAGFQPVVALAIDATGNIFALEDNNEDVINCKVRKITPAGVVTTYAEGIRSPVAIAVAKNGIIYVTEASGRIMQVATDGTTSLLAGQLGYGRADGTGANAAFNNPQGLTTDQNGNVYIADFGNSLIRKITPAGVVSTFAGAQTFGSADGVGTAASFFNPRNVACDSKGYIVVSDQNNYLIRKIAPDGTVTTLAGPMVYNQQNQSTGVDVPNVFFLDKNDNIIYAGGFNNQYFKLTTTGYSISPDLPPGLNFNPDGSISGTPTALSPTRNYIVRASNDNGVSQASVNLQVVVPANPPVITSFTPTAVPAGSELTITGNYFTGATGVTIGGKPAAEFNVNSPTSITATVANGAASGALTVTNTYGTATASGYTLIPPPVITSISPTTGWKGSTITINGTNLTGATNIQIGGNYATSFTVVSSTKVTATVGDASSGSVSLYTPAGLATFAGFIFLNPPSVSSISPASAAKGATVTIGGANFTNASAVKIGGTDVTSFTVVSPTSISAVVGNGSSGQVSVTTPVGTSAGSNFTFILPPTITSASPLKGGYNSSILINGSNLTAAQVTIGNVPAAITYSTPGQILATVGVGAASGDIVVTTVAGTATLSGFIFVPAPQITSFTPLTAAQDDIVTITGSNLTEVTNVNFGSVGATFTVVSPTSIKATVGYGASGSLQVVSPGGTASLAGFTHLGPAITSFAPAQAGPGQVVTINGSNFSGATGVDFGGIPATSFTIVSATRITAVVGAGASGNVTVTTPSGKGVLSGFVHPGPSITSISPNYAGPQSSTAITISGTNFNNLTSITFGGILTTAYTVLSSTLITVRPANAASGDVVVTTTSGSAKYSGFTWVQPPTITLATPLSQQSGGTVTITGTNFTGVTDVKFGGVPANFFTSNANSISAIVGNGASGDITVSTAGGSATFSGFNYTSPVLQSISPTVAAAGQTVTLAGTNLDAVQSVKFGNINAASFTIISPQQITAVMATGASGSVTVTGTRGSAVIPGFVFLPPPAIFSFTPTEGGAGTTISINGQNLLTTSSVTIGGTPATIVSIANNVVQVKAGAGATGMVSLTTSAGTTQLDGFTWYLPPVITAANPMAANAETVVTITGANFTGANQVKFGNMVAGFTIVSPTSIIATPVSGSSGDITVTGPGGTGTLPGFIFLQGPVITSFSTLGEGPAASVTISGSNFNQVSDVEFGGVPASQFTVSSPGTIIASPGAGATGLITVKANGGTATFRGFLYRQPPQVNSLSPLSGPVGTTLTITGNNFDPSADQNVVYLGAVQGKVLNATKTQLQVSVPAGASGQVIVENLNSKLLAYADLPFLITNNNGAPAFSNKLELSFSSTPNRYAIEDFDGDNKPDLLIAKEDSLYILRNNGDKILSHASFAEKIDLKLGRLVQSMVVGDVDGDGKKDILISIANSVMLLHNTSVNNVISFDLQSLPAVTNSLDGMSLRDIDMDGRPDLIMGGADPVYYPNTTMGSQVSFGGRMYLANTSSSSNISFALADIDGDNKPDPINGSSYTGFSVFHNQSVPGGFSALDFPLAYIQPSGSYTPYAIATADFDGDKKLDVITDDFSFNYFQAFKNISTPGNITSSSFEVAKDFPCSFYMQYEFSPADLDGDGKIDLVSSSGGTVYYFANQSSPGNISFGSGIPLIKGNSGDLLAKINLADFDGDGRQDLVLLDVSNKKITIYNNSAPATPVITAFSPQSAGKGQKVTITGKYFDGATSVKFGAMSADSFVVKSSGLIEALVGNGGSGNVSVQTSLGTATLSGFDFIGVPSISAVTLPPDGSGMITINGMNFTGATGVELSGLPVTSFQVISNTSITAVLSTLTGGTLTVTTPSGHTSYTLNLNPPETITFGAIPDHTYGDGDFTLSATSDNSVTPVTYNSDNTAIATVNNGTVHILKAGTVTITASQAEDGSHRAATDVKQVLNIEKGVLNVAADDVSRPYGQSNPEFTLSYTGFINGDDESKLSSRPSVTTTANASSTTGQYNLVPEGGASENYNFVFSGGTLTVTPEPDNFKIAATSITCKGEHNGSITITAVRSDNYTALLTGSGLNKSYPFNSSSSIHDLAPGSYHVCITDAGVPGYQQCFDLSITEPQDLSVYAIINKTDNTVMLSLQGGSSYSIRLNNNTYITNDQSITLPLEHGQNKLSVTADKICQGTFEQTINSSPVPYPNPFQQTLNLDMGNKALSGMISIYSATEGNLKFRQAFNNQTGALTLNLSGLGLGVYSLHLNIDNKESIYKIIKQ